MNAFRVPILGQAGGRTDLAMGNGITSLGHGVLEASASPKWEIRNFRPGSSTEWPAEAPIFLRPWDTELMCLLPAIPTAVGSVAGLPGSEILALTRPCQARLHWGAGCLEGCGKKTVKLVLKAHEDRQE